MNFQFDHINKSPHQQSIKLISYFLFLVGFLYYCIFPIIFLSLFPGNPISKIVLEKYPECYMESYLYLILFYFILFSCGYYLCSKNKVIKPKRYRGNGIGKLSVLVTICYVCITICIVNMKEIISPPGYLNGFDVAHRGQLTTLYLVSIWWFVYLKSAVKTNIQAKLMLIIVFIVGLNLLTLGSRLGVISGMITLFIFYVYFINGRLQDRGVQKREFIKWFIIICVVAILMSLIGLLRSRANISWEGVINIFVAEPLFIYASVPAFFSNNSLPLVAIPSDLFASIVGAIPSYIFPEKLAFFASYSVINTDSSSGFGGLHHIITLIANFGLIGFPFVAFFEGAWFGMLVRHVHANAFFRTVALSSIAMLTFVIFRDGLQTSIKLLFFNFLVFPYIMIQVLLLIKSSIRSAPLLDLNS